VSYLVNNNQDCGRDGDRACGIFVADPFDRLRAGSAAATMNRQSIISGLHLGIARCCDAFRVSAARTISAKSLTVICAMGTLTS
jgi:hypothetical protein